MKGKTVSRQKSLELLDMFLHMDAVTLIQSSFVRTVASGFFFKNKDNFRTNPANTLLYQSLRALEERAVVNPNLISNVADVLERWRRRALLLAPSMRIRHRTCQRGKRDSSPWLGSGVDCWRRGQNGPWRRMGRSCTSDWERARRS